MNKTHPEPSELTSGYILKRVNDLETRLRKLEDFLKIKNKTDINIVLVDKKGFEKVVQTQLPLQPLFQIAVLETRNVVIDTNPPIEQSYSAIVFRRTNEKNEDGLVIYKED